MEPLDRTGPDFGRRQGRAAAVQAILDDPIKRAEMEATWGMDRMRERYPEVYAKRRSLRFNRWMDMFRIFR